MGDTPTLDQKTLLAQIEALRAQVAAMSGKTKGDGRVVEDIERSFDSKVSDVKHLVVRAGNVQGPSGKVPGVIGLYVGKFVKAKKGLVPDSSTFIQGGDADTFIAALLEARAEAKTRGYF